MTEHKSSQVDYLDRRVTVYYTRHVDYSNDYDVPDFVYYEIEAVYYKGRDVTRFVDVDEIEKYL